MKHQALYTVAIAAAVVAAGWLWPEPPIVDEAMERGLTTADFPQLEVDAFPELDRGEGPPLTREAIRGRNTWILWTAGSERFLDWLAREGYGISDMLKMLDSRKRDTRFDRLGLINEPGFVKASERDRHGLWLDVPASGARMGRTDMLIVGEGIAEEVYGRSTGVMGFRLFDNPEFDAEAQEAWDPERYYCDETYSRNPELVRPYRVGMSCGVCHVAFNPVDPPPDPNHPEWHHLASLIGNQYFREGRVFASNLESPEEAREPAEGCPKPERHEEGEPEEPEPSSFLWEMLEAQPPGTSDTSRMATDHINNPNAINGIFNLDARLAVAHEAPESLETVQAIWHEADTPQDLHVPHILKDGADSVGLAGAALRVYVNIGLFSEYWLTLHKPIVGVRYQRPFEVEYAREHSVYWQATEKRMPDLAEFFRSAPSFPLRLALLDPELSESYEETLGRGRVVFARKCAGCHSSDRPSGIEVPSPEATEWFEESILAGDFQKDNFLSEDKRHRIDHIGTNACRALATNAKRGRIWDNFSSETYKTLDAVEEIEVFDPFGPLDAGNTKPWSLKDRCIEHSLGYYRTPSLVSLWTSAPFLHNNSLGDYTGDPSVDGRLRAFHDAADKLLWPEKRKKAGSIWRTQRESVIQMPLASLPSLARGIAVHAGLVAEGKNGVQYARLGPIPKGTSINLLGNLDLSLGSASDFSKAVKLIKLLRAIRKTLRIVNADEFDKSQTLEVMKERLLTPLLDNSKCPDLIEDRGHEFGAELSEADKEALIEFLKTL